MVVQSDAKKWVLKVNRLALKVLTNYMKSVSID